MGDLPGSVRGDQRRVSARGKFSRDFHFARRIRAFVHQHASPHARFLHRTLFRSQLKPRSTWNRLEPPLSGHFSDTAPHLCPFFARRLRCTRRASVCRDR